MSWNENFFNLFYQELFMNRDEQQLIHEKEIISNIAQIKRGDTIVDFCCGIGDIIHTFKKDQFDVSGVDFSSEYIQHARNNLHLHNAFEGDALTFNFNKKFDIALNWFSSFGYFSDEDNQKLIDNIYTHLNNKGKFLLEVFNSYNVVRNYTECFKYEKSYHGKPVYITRNSQLTLDSRTLNQHWIFKYDGKETEYKTEHKIYFIDEIIDKMKNAGFKNIKCFERPEHDIIIRDANLDSKRIIFIGEK